MKKKIFISFSEKDVNLFEALTKHLKPLESAGLIEVWSRRLIQPGENRDNSIKLELSKSEVILFLLSSDFIASDDSIIEFSLAMEYHKSQGATIVPVILRDCFWELTGYSAFQPLPPNGVAVTNKKWVNIDTPFKGIAKEIERIIRSGVARKSNAESSVRAITLEIEENSNSGNSVMNRLSVKNSVLEGHKNEIRRWAAEIISNESNKSKNILKTYVHLDYYYLPRRFALTTSTRKEILLDELVFKHKNHLVFIGQPGAGKTTSMKYLCFKILNDPGFGKGFYVFPLLIRLRNIDADILEFNSNMNLNYILTDQIYRKLNLRSDENAKCFNNTSLSMGDVKQKEFINLRYLLDDLHPIVIFDGLDEIPEQKNREAIVREFNRLCLGLSKCKLILTSRTGEVSNYRFEKAQVYEICHLSLEQIKSFIFNWLDDEKEVQYLYEEVLNSPFFDTTIRPLNLALLCALFERDGEIPDSPIVIYKKIINLLLQEWSQQNLIKRSSKYIEFEVNKKYDFLCAIAFELTKGGSKSVFTEGELHLSYNLICNSFGLKKEDWKSVTEEIETHNGLFLRAGYSKFEFAHKSIQEFLMAEHLKKLPAIPNFVNIKLLPNEFALMIASANKNAKKFYQLTSKLVSDSGFIGPFLERLALERVQFTACIEIGVSLVLLDNQYRSDRAVVSGFFKYCQGITSIEKSILMIPKYYNIQKEISKGHYIIQFKQNKKTLPAILTYRSNFLRLR